MAENTSPYAEDAVPATIYYDDQKGTGADVVPVLHKAEDLEPKPAKKDKVNSDE